MAWIAGEWAKEEGSNRLEESWSVARGDSMIGMFRWLKDGKVWIYDALAGASRTVAIPQRDDCPVCAGNR